MAAANPGNSLEQDALRKAESAETMASTDFWQELMGKLAGDEANCLLQLDDYLINELHPDREEVITLCLKWHAVRRHRLRMLDEVERARQMKTAFEESQLEPHWSDYPPGN